MRPPPDQKPVATGSRGDGQSGARVKIKAVPVKAPAGDVASSGGDYGLKQAKQAAAKNPVVRRNTAAVYAAQPVAQRKQIVKNATGPTAKIVQDVHEQRRQRAEDLAHAQAAHDIMTAQDKKTADAFNAAHPTYTKVMPIAKQMAEARTGGALGKLTGLNIKKALDNVPKDALELAATTPSSVAKIASTAVTHPTKVPGLLAEPYKQLIKDPKGFIESHPVSTALMLNPAARIPGRAVGRVARLTGKQTLARPTATLPGTALKETRVGSKDFTIRAMQARKDAKTAAPVMTAKQVQRQVDETYAASKTHTGRVEASAYRVAKNQAKALPRAERKPTILAHMEGARGGAQNQGEVRFAKQFGATAYHTPEGVLVKPKTATEGVLHPTRDAASAVAEGLNRKVPTLKPGSRLYRNTPVPNDFVVRQAGDKFAVIPKVAADRMTKQRAVGTSKATGAKILRQSRSMFTRTVLPYRPTWLSGQGIEGVVRSAVSGAGPTSYLRARKEINAMEAIKPGSGKALLERAAPGGLVGQTAAHEMTTKTLHQEFPDSTIARALTDVGQTPGIKQVRQLHHAVSSFVFEKLNAKALEGIPQTMMLGKALKDSPLMERSIIGLSDKAIQDAAHGLQATENQVALARAVEGMYGKYQGFSPKMRELIMHWTPFIPWYLNTAKFLLTTLPKDHPLAGALAASSGAATEEWRKKAGLSTRGGQTLPPFMLGGYPTDGGKSITRIGHYTPFGVGTDVTNAVAALPLPQFKSFYDAVSSGMDWKGHQLKHPDGRVFNQGERWLYGLTQLGESFVPLASQTQAVLGAQDKGAALKKQFRLISSTPSNRATKPGPGVITPVRVKPVRVKPIRIKPIR